MKRVIFFFLLLFIPAALGLAWLKLTRISQIRCKSQYGPCSQYLEQKLGEIERLDYFKTVKLLKKTLSGQVISKDYSIQFLFPNKIEVGVIERKANLAVTSLGELKFYLVDEESKILGVEKTTALPILVVDNLGEVNVGDQLGGEIGFSGKILGEMRQLFGLDLGYLTGEGMEILMESGTRVIFPKEGNAEALVGSLRLILESLGEQAPELIDLRYKNPVVK